MYWEDDKSKRKIDYRLEISSEPISKRHSLVFVLVTSIRITISFNRRMNRFKEKKKWLKICYCKSNFMSWRSRQKCKWRALIKFNQGCLTFQHNRLGRKARNTSLTEIYKNNLEPKFVEDSPEHIFYLKIIVECPWKSAARRLLSLQPSKQILTGNHKKSMERCIGVTQRIHLLLLFVLRSRRWDQSVSSAASVCPEVAD